MTGAEASVHPSAFVFVAVALIGGILAVSLQNVLHAIFGFAMAVLGIAGLFFYLGSPFVAAMQVVIYVGGISVAMVFAVMFSYTLGASRLASSRGWRAIIPAGALLAALVLLIRRGGFVVAPLERDWSLATIGRALLTHYNVVFEALSVVLLLAIVGAIIIARREPEA